MAGKHGKDFSDSDDDSKQTQQKTAKKVIEKLEFMSVAEIKKKLERLENLHDAPEELFQPLAKHLFPLLEEQYLKTLKESFERFMSDKCGRRSVEELLERARKVFACFKLYSEGVDQFDGDLKTQLEKYLVRTFSPQVLNALSQFLLAENGLDPQAPVKKNYSSSYSKIFLHHTILKKYKLFVLFRTDHRFAVIPIEREPPGIIEIATQCSRLDPNGRIDIAPSFETQWDRKGCFI